MKQNVTDPKTRMNTKSYLLLTLAALLVFAIPVKAQNKGFGLGLVLGEPTGLSAKLWTSRENAFDFGLGLAVGGDRISYNGKYDGGSRIHFHMDYLWHSFNALGTTGRTPFYYGIGGRFNNGGGYEGSLGVRGVIGIAWLPSSTPLDLFIEVVPVLQLTPVNGFGIDAGAGIRYFFQ